MIQFVLTSEDVELFNTGAFTETSGINGLVMAAQFLLTQKM